MLYHQRANEPRAAQHSRSPPPFLKVILAFRKGHNKNTFHRCFYVFQRRLIRLGRKCSSVLMCFILPEKSDFLLHHKDEQQVLDKIEHQA